MVEDLEEYFKITPISDMYINYNYNNVLSYTYYDDIYKNIIEAQLKLGEHGDHYWNIKFNKKFYCKLVSSYFTKENITYFNNKINKPTKLLHKSCTDPNTDTYIVELKYNSIIIKAIIDRAFDVYLEYYKDYTKMTIYDTKTNTVREIHILGKDYYFIQNFIENYEYLYYKDEEIMYEFNKSNLSKSNYLQYHNPFRITNYTRNKQYIVEYDDNGIMTSMKDISNPEIELCTYDKNTITFGSTSEYESISVHPDIYNSFTREELSPNFIEDNKYVVEKYITGETLGYNIYKRHSFIKTEDRLVDQ